MRRIFDMTLDGMGTHQIADALSKYKILTPTNYWINKGVHRGAKKTSPDPYHWNPSAIISILDKQEYCGDVINFKTYSKSYKNKKRIANDKDSLAVFKDVHPLLSSTRYGSTYRKNAKSGVKKHSPAVKRICFPVCSYALTAEAISVFTLTKEIMIYNTSIVWAITAANARHVRQPITYELIFSKKLS